RPRRRPRPGPRGRGSHRRRGRHRRRRRRADDARLPRPRPPDHAHPARPPPGRSMTSDATRGNGEIVTPTGFALHLAGVRKTSRPGTAELITAVNDASLDLAAGDTAALT